MELTIEHLIIMLLTVALVIGGGIYSARSVKSAEGYSLGGRSAGVPLVAGSIANLEFLFTIGTYNEVQGCLWLQAVLLVL